MNSATRWVVKRLVFIGNCTVALESRAYHCYKDGDIILQEKKRTKPVPVTGCNDSDLFLQDEAFHADRKWMQNGCLRQINNFFFLF